MSAGKVPVFGRLYWSIRRELWENRSIYMAPLVVAGIVLIAFFIGVFTLPARMPDEVRSSPDAVRRLLEQTYVVAAMVLMVVEMLVAMFYSVEALYGERRDRSVLFWKSLPVSDLTTVISKASIPILLLPLVTFVITVATQGVMLLASGVVLAANGVDTAAMAPLPSMWDIASINFGHLVGFHGIWMAPLYAWLLLASAWATRVPFLWALLPPAAMAVVERIAFDSTHFVTMLQSHFFGSMEAGGAGGSGAGENVMTMAMLAPHPFAHFVASPGLWVGLTLTALFLFGAARVRRARGAI